MKVHHQHPHVIDFAQHHKHPQHHRTSGTHVSGIIKHLAHKHGILKPRPNPDPNPSATAMYFACGFAWEYYCAKFIPGLIHQPGELELDGIFMSPDGYTLSPTGSLILHEFKFTWTSSARPIQERYMWLWQGMSYLAGMSAKFRDKCLTMVLHPMYINGDYRTHRHPTYTPVMLEFSWEEIMVNWELMLASRGMAEPEIVLEEVA